VIKPGRRSTPVLVESKGTLRASESEPDRRQHEELVVEWSPLTAESFSAGMMPGWPNHRELAQERSRFAQHPGTSQEPASRRMARARRRMAGLRMILPRINHRHRRHGRRGRARRPPRPPTRNRWRARPAV
jgi:hypothetical protein